MAGRSGTGKELEGVAGNRLLVREGDCLHVIELGSAFRTPAFGCATTWTYHEPSGGHGDSSSGRSWRCRRTGPG